MYLCPFYPNCINNLSARQEPAYIRVLHASPKAPAVDVYINNNPIIRGLSYRGFSKYFNLPPGKYNIKVFRSGTSTAPIINTNLDLAAGTIYTAAAIGELLNVSIYPIIDPRIPKSPGRVHLRVVHLSPNTPSVNITLPNGSVLFRDITYKEVANYIITRPGVYTVDVRLSSNNQSILHVPNIRLLPNRFYTIYVVGLSGGTPSLQTLIPLDGNSYLFP